MPDHVPTFRCGNRGGFTAGVLVALWLALCAGFVAATAGRPTPIAVYATARQGADDASRRDRELALRADGVHQHRDLRGAR